MRSLKYFIGGLIALLLLHGSAFAQTATATSTATATATASPTATAPASASTPFAARGSSFGFIAPVMPNYPVGNGGLGGRIIVEKATSSLLLGQIVKPDSANTSSVVVSTSGTTDPIGVVIGSSGYSASCPSQKGTIGVAPCTGQNAVIQINGLALVACDRQLFPGNVVMSSTLVNGDAGPYVAGTVDEQIGVIISGCLVNGAGTILLYK